VGDEHVLARDEGFAVEPDVRQGGEAIEAKNQIVGLIDTAWVKSGVDSWRLRLPIVGSIYLSFAEC
jgi:hypothetical protein